MSRYSRPPQQNKKNNMSKDQQITQLSEEKYLHEQPARYFAPLEDLLASGEEKIIDGELYIRHIDGEFRKVSLKTVTKLFLEARMVAVSTPDDDEPQEDDEEDEDDTCTCPACTLRRLFTGSVDQQNLAQAASEESPAGDMLTIKDYAEELGLTLAVASYIGLSRWALVVSKEVGKTYSEGVNILLTKFDRSVLDEVFKPVLNKR